VNHYDVLEVSRTASPEVIRAAYRSLMQRFHPDKHPGDEAIAARATAIAAAYGVLSDTDRRSEYDRQLAQAEAQPRWTDPPVARSAARPAPDRRSVPGRGLGAWWWLLPITAAAAIGVFTSVSTRKADPGAELAAIRKSFASKTATEAQRRELHARKSELLARHPDLLRTASAEKAEDMAARTFALLDAPLKVRIGQERDGGALPVELTLQGISLLVGSFDAPEMLAHMGQHKELLVQELMQRLAKEDPGRLAGQDGPANLKRVVMQSVAGTLRTPPGQDYPSTWFESPGRYGVVDVLLAN